MNANQLEEMTYRMFDIMIFDTDTDYTFAVKRLTRIVERIRSNFITTEDQIVSALSRLEEIVHTKY